MAAAVHGSPQPDASVSTSTADTAPIGRAPELTVLDGLLDRLDAGRGGSVLVSGPTGVGKTTMAHELRSRATARGARVLAGRAYSVQAELAYGPLVDALGGVVRDAAPDGQLVHGLTSLGQLFDGLPVGDGPADPRLGRARLATALVALVHRLVTAGPVVLVLDDVHWADDATVELLPLLLGDLDRVPLLVVTVARTDGEPAAIVSTLRRMVDVEMPLGPLDRAGSEALVRRLLGGAPPPVELIGPVHERTGGSPLLVCEVVGELLATGQLSEHRGRWRLDTERLPLPRTATELLSERLATCDEADLAILEPMALHGSPIDERVLIALGVDTRRLRRLDERGLVTADDHVSGRRWELAHPALSEVVADRIDPERRRGWHDRLARAFATSDPDRYAHHLLHAGPAAVSITGDLETLVRELRDAAERAARRGSLVLACQLLTACLEHLRTSTPSPAHADVASRLALMWSARGHHDVGAALAREALDERLALGDVVAAIEAADPLGEMEFYLGRSDTGWLDELRHAAEGTGDDELVLQVRFREYAERARRVGLEPDADAMLRLTDRILATEHASDRARRTAHALRTLGRAHTLPADDGLTDTIRAAAIDVDDQPTLAHRCWNALLDRHLMRGDWSGVDRTIEEMSRFEERHGRLENWRIRFAQAQVLVFTGRPATARELEIVHRGLLSPNPRALTMMTMLHVMADAALGDAYRLAEDLDQLDSLTPDIARFDQWSINLVTASALLAAATLGDLDRVRATAPPDHLFTTGTPLVPAYCTLRAAWALGDGDAVLRVTRELRAADPSGVALPTAVAELFEGLVAGTAGTAEDLGRLRRARTLLDRLGVPLLAAEAALALDDAGALAPGTLADVLDRLDLGDPTPAAVTRAVAARVGRTATVVEDDPLTAREREVADLVIEGLSNREVAERLFISVRTVTSHLDHIYTKLGIGSRAELSSHRRP